MKPNRLIHVHALHKSHNFLYILSYCPLFIYGIFPRNLSHLNKTTTENIQETGTKSFGTMSLLCHFKLSLDIFKRGYNFEIVMLTMQLLG